ncbi:MAG TPA: SET domain-containing protein-lysine N-methyltransferase [Chlamydiales bacterium]|nr:SET domain-containing protein-lysine N-methyltransferase [Chlamydiales bacterium]
MEQLLQTKINRPLCSEIFESDPEKRAELLFWQNALDDVAEGKIQWDPFLQGLKKPLASHPAARIATTRDGQTLLHLAVLADRRDLVQELKNELFLKLRRNGFGLTPLEIAQFLNRKECAQWLQPTRYLDKLMIEERFKNLEYLAHPIFETDQILVDILKRSKKAKMDDEIPPEKIWMGVYFDKEIQRGMHPPVSIQAIDKEVGFGVFAEKRIAPCAFVGEYTGIIRERKRKQLRDKYYCVRYTVWDMGRRNFVIDAEEKGNFTRFINHSPNPNLGLQSVYWRGLPRMILVALREIAEGTQLTFDYGPIFWKECAQIPKNLS